MAEQVPNDTLPLSGIRVVEFTHMVMGPSAGLVLADLGAEVIKIEPLKGDNTRRLKGSGAGYFPMYNRNKQSLCLDLKSEEGQEVALTLIDKADVLIENFRPGAMDKLGFSYQALRETNPRLIYCSLKGFLDGPYQHRTALDEVTQMMGGLAYMTGLPGKPMRAGSSVIDITGGMFGAIAILAALEERHRTGLGQQVKSSLFESTAFMVGQHMAQQAVSGNPLQPMSVRTSAWAVYDIFDTCDGEQVFVGVVSDTQWKIFCQAFNLESFGSDPGLALNNDRVSQRERILPVIREQLGALTKPQLMAKLEETGLPFAPIASPSDLFDDPHLNAGGGLIEVSLPDNGGKARLPGLPIDLAGRRLGLRQDLPGEGEHSRQALQSIGYSDEKIAELSRNGVIR
ncbi:Acetyl-CoA:oxalate CoA-transferase [Zhongshania aliphaticivorans]|uniref:Acetyl-CoA:oxalate CoA-transferase n=1 Tax=Zhongshania aliphaticivorans TaxID=1470434 RepID=A0A5S9MWQ2_9GAMM|nr:CaiB/BaiF CoA-transferase family protein [Zhongshania aliphaticivorans]CAA0081587.1 Acetyl-CoA:oxalate CoA-transferase [Zhongshania aliphaticivorans]CAA0084793.1 Acetyl-CoA:oxalate CoA-transferase [Zhongshania aliphaticivorans]